MNDYFEKQKEIDFIIFLPQNTFRNLPACAVISMTIPQKKAIARKEQDYHTVSLLVIGLRSSFLRILYEFSLLQLKQVGAFGWGGCYLCVHKNRKMR